MEPKMNIDLALLVVVRHSLRYFPHDTISVDGFKVTVERFNRKKQGYMN